MIELPETYVLAEQINETIVGKTIANVTANASPHAFAWYSGNPEDYQQKLSGKPVTKATPGTGYTCGGNTEILCGDMLLLLSTPIRYHGMGDKLPKKHQLLIEFDDQTYLSCTVQMWGAMLCFPADEEGWPAGFTVKKSPTPMEDGFDMPYFMALAQGKEDLSAKAFLATEQRIPGLGNGVLQDILFRAGIHPRTRLKNIEPDGLETLYHSVRETLLMMATGGGRDTEKDLYGCNGGYQTILSRKTVGKPCGVCGSSIIREAYLGGNIYYCPQCQPYIK